MPRSEPEKQECDRHPGSFEVWCWVWPEGSTIEDSTPEIVESCPKCVEEEEAEERRELRRLGLLD